MKSVIVATLCAQLAKSAVQLNKAGATLCWNWESSTNQTTYWQYRNCEWQ